MGGSRLPEVSPHECPLKQMLVTWYTDVFVLMASNARPKRFADCPALLMIHVTMREV